MMADINLKDEKRISVNGEYDLVTTHPNNEPIYRSNGHELELNASNSDYLALDSEKEIVNVGDYVEFVFESNSNTNNQGIISQLIDFSGNYLARLSSNLVFISGLGGSTILSSLIFVNGLNTLRIEKISSGFDLTLNGVSQNTTAFTSFKYQKFFGIGVVSENFILHEIDINGETFNPTNINSNAQIEVSNGTIAQVNSSAADPINYILGTVFQKSGFALVGNGSTQKIVSPLGGEIVLTSTPLEGGFSLDGKTYNLTEGLGNVIKSTDGTTECDIVGFSGTSINFGGWLKGDNINGWNPYTA